MKSKLLKIILWGLLVWVIPFVVAFFIFPLRQNERPLFESIMPVVLTAVTIIASLLYFSKVEVNFLKEGLLVGLIWLLISLAIDLLLFMQGPMKMALLDYLKDIGFTYLIIPAVTLGFGYLLEKKHPA